MVYSRQLYRFPFGQVNHQDKEGLGHFEEIWKGKEEDLTNHYGNELWVADSDFPEALKGVEVSSLDDLLASDCRYVISAIAPRFGFLEDKLIEHGINVISISPYKRQENCLTVLEANHEDLKKSLPELPDNKKERFIKDYELNSYEANVLVSEKEISDYYEEVAKLSDKKLAATWMMGDLFAMLNNKGLNISNSPISAKNFAELVQSIKSEEISGRIAKEVFEIMVNTGENPKKIIETKGMKQQSDPKELEKIINKILTSNKDKVDQYKAGKEKLFGFFVGQVMKSSGGKANPQLTNEILKKLLKG